MNCICILRKTICSQLPTSTHRFLLQSEPAQVLKRNLTSKVKNFKLNQNIGRIDRRNAAYLLRHTTWKDLQELYEIARPFKKWIFLGTSFMVLSSGIFLIIPRILGKLIDQFDSNRTTPSSSSEEEITMKIAKFFKNHPIALVELLAIGALATAAKVYCLQLAGVNIVGSLRKAVYSSIIRQDMTFFDKNMVGEIGSRHAADTVIVGYSVSSSLRAGVRAVLVGVGSVGMMLMTSIELSTVSFLTAPIVMGIFKMFGKVQQQCTWQLQEVAADVNQTAVERMANIKTVRMLSAEQQSIEEYCKKGELILDISKTEALAKGSLIGSFQFTGYSAFSSILFYGSHLINTGHITYGELSSFCLYAVLAAASLSNISGFYNEVMKGLGASSRLLELKNAQPAMNINSGIRKTDIRESIRFENVSFAYAGRKSTLNNITFDIPRGKITAVIGPSGSGKSSIASLMLRLYDPAEGRITVDGIDLRDMNATAWRHAIGTVGQEPVLFTSSIRENILLGAEYPNSINQNQLETAAQLANALDFIQGFENGFETMVGEHGCKLSGGQKQRIAIARALVSNPKILIFDEATSALDATSDYLIRMTLDNLLKNHNLTVLVIAHRLATMEQADKVVYVNRGRIEGQGTFEEMMKIQFSIVEQEAKKRGIPMNEQMSRVNTPVAPGFSLKF
ncbi:CBN-HAF-1 protein [Caenorhabditis brenneri]|uniref:CBN-HAF-1 protein n=1 Tax=Caenorhabditis brenneri TaxID=135651 RepID=G0MRH3_CAEBE|nr:CBN-HAF-1 protein [Caenorhabditis brenneri]